MPSSFADHFSGHASDYARYRPDYPASLFDFLAGLAPGRGGAWDCATGSGQAACALAERPRVLYAVATAEEPPLSDQSVDLVTVAQALHWFDRDRFWPQVQRVLVPGGIIAVWYYDLFRSSAEVDRVVHRFYQEIVGPYWPVERRLIEEGYDSLGFPFEEIAAVPFAMEKGWALADLVGYLNTWSATRRYADARGESPLPAIEEELERAWGDPGQKRSIVWDLHIRLGRARSAVRAATIEP
jgi:SAM-dependent methyltransferase